MSAENEKESCSQRDSAERKGYVRAHRSFNRIWKERDSAEPDILGKILERDNMNRAYKRVKANKGAPGVDGMTIEAALPWLREHKDELIGRIKRGKYTPSPVRRVEIPKPDGGIRKLGIPTVIDRIVVVKLFCNICGLNLLDCCLEAIGTVRFYQWCFAPLRGHAIDQICHFRFFAITQSNQETCFRRPLCCCPHLVWCAVTVIAMWAHMIVGSIGEFLHRVIEFLFRPKFVQIRAFVL